MPFFFAGLDVGLLLAILGAVVGEFLGAQVGLGNMIQLLQYSFDVAGMFSVLLVLSMMGILAHILIRTLQRKFAFWGETDHLAGS
jgi:NitT/TauT family transport system permease protein